MSEVMSGRQVIVIGGGLGGLWATLTLAEAGQRVRLFSLFEVMRSHSVCAQGGINAVLDMKGEHDSVWQHIVDTIKGGSYLANQPPIKSMCEDAPGLIHTFERMGVTFSRTPEGLLDQRLFGGVKKKRTCFAGASTGQQLLYGVDQQVRRLETEGKVEKYEWWEFLSIVKDADGVCRGIVAMDLRSLEVRAFAPTPWCSPPAAWVRSMRPRPPAPPTPPAPPRAASISRARALPTPSSSSFTPRPCWGRTRPG
jgi:succinate dehydrogenase / fumarate reductase flavoprotein subunit